ncbi:MAG UNVERIFIED_CONTAM: hypothetical protein LVR18_40245 [Planctomycetaceae bacterium]|jgi:hypothetical protein
MRNLNTKSEHVSVSGLRPMDSGCFADNPLELHSGNDSADETTEATSIDFTDFLRPAATDRKGTSETRESIGRIVEDVRGGREG